MYVLAHNVESEKADLTEIENRMVVSRDWGGWGMGRCWLKHIELQLGGISTRVLFHSMVTIVNDDILFS
jgi:hypothetical protein